MAKKKKKKMGYKAQLFIVLCVLVSVLFSAVSIILAIGMLPTVVATIVDRSEGKIRALTIGAMNLAGCAPFVVDVLKGGNNIETAINFIVQPETIIVMYFAAGIGYVIDWSMTGIVSSMIVQKGKKRLKDIEKNKKELIDRWGIEVTGTIPLDEFGFPRAPAEKASTEEAPS